MVIVECMSCGHKNHFHQPYPYHAGFGNQGFLYNDEGNLTLSWSSFDSSYESMVGKKHPWTLTTDEQTLVENALCPAATGGRWRFSNPARCFRCSEPISGPMSETIYYLRYPGSFDADPDPEGRCLKDFLSSVNPKD